MTVKMRSIAVVAFMMGAALTACGAEPMAARQADPATSDSRSGAGGAFSAVVADAKDDVNQELTKLLKEEKTLEEVAQGFNDLLKLPEGDYVLATEECGQANAFWSPDDKKITICYELLTDAVAKAEENFSTEQEKDDYVTGVLLDTLFHELGHALISIYDLPTVGKEDDAVDQLSAIYMIEIGEAGQNYALQAAQSYFIAAGDSDRDSLPFYDEHSMDEQRAYNYACLVYGSDPEKFADLVGETDDSYLPQARAERCPEEWAKVSAAWNKLLEPHLRSS
ncbi:DUF4344 domain-containing metallopeptidase [Nonomuraea pusilla]|uniref:Putative metallopeptidase n=1 Tax=Nonomuraea pusilla TaxID=46177 RepID=A0A1H7GHD5_9ACTN|nr:DUF4344 domain-containing metallopeptidase [Nonomuraea pusilla]SEK35880.1 Putative metallopeptidase [Nonomuraea pusilla]